MTLVLKRASASRRSDEWDEDDYEVLADGVAVGRIFKAEVSPPGTPWMWTMLFDYRWPNHGYEPTRYWHSPRAGYGNRPAPPLAWPLARSANARGIEIPGASPSSHSLPSAFSGKIDAAKSSLSL